MVIIKDLLMHIGRDNETGMEARRHFCRQKQVHLQPLYQNLTTKCTSSMNELWCDS